MQYSPPQYLEEVYNRRRLNFEEMLKSDCKNLKRCTLSDKILAEDKGRQGMYFRRKAYDQLLAWKKDYADSYAILIEGARRVERIGTMFLRKSVFHCGYRSLQDSSLWR
jgi:hypothetical protein